MLVIDLDKFKEVNDVFGQEVGDGCSGLSPSDSDLSRPDRHTVARVGGDEFAVLLQGGRVAGPDSSVATRRGAGGSITRTKPSEQLDEDCHALGQYRCGRARPPSVTAQS